MTRTAKEVKDLFEKFNLFPVLGTSQQEYIPYDIIAPHEEQAMRNHGGQTLQRLAERGGLSWGEIFAVLTDSKWSKAFGVGHDKMKTAVLEHIKRSGKL